jgi:hypothetical protein
MKSARKCVSNTGRGYAASHGPAAVLEARVGQGPGVLNAGVRAALRVAAESGEPVVRTPDASRKPAICRRQRKPADRMADADRAPGGYAMAVAESKVALSG